MVATEAGFGPLALRLPIGIIFVAHGAQKEFGAFGGYGLQGTGQFMASTGLTPSHLMALLAGSAEFFGWLGAAAPCRAGGVAGPDGAGPAATTLIGLSQGEILALDHPPPAVRSGAWVDLNNATPRSRHHVRRPLARRTRIRLRGGRSRRRGHASIAVVESRQSLVSMPASA